MAASQTVNERAHLTPLLAAFKADGNHPVGRWLQPSQGQWDVYMRKPLDPALIERHLETDPHHDEIRIGNDALHCAHCQSSIHGPNAPD